MFDGVEPQSVFVFVFVLVLVLDSVFVLIAVSDIVFIGLNEESIPEEEEEEEEGERARAVVTAKLPPAENPLKNTFVESIPNSRGWERMYSVASIQSFTGVG